MEHTYNAPVHPVAGDFKPLFTSMVMQKDLAEQEVIRLRGRVTEYTAALTTAARLLAEQQEEIIALEERLRELDKTS